MPDQPNILFLISDQHSPRVLGCAGDPVIRTPNLDVLAARGVMFDNAYCASPLCVPSRMTMLTSRHCSDIEVWTNGCYLASDIPTFCHSLGAAGYETVLGGRMHFIGPDQLHGFHRRIIGDVASYTHPGGGGPNFTHIPPAGCGQSRSCIEVQGPGRTTYQAYDDAVGEACGNFLRQRAASDDDRPFCLVAGFVLPHCPFIAPKALYDYYLTNLPLPEIPDGYFDSLPPAMKKWREDRGVHDLTEDEIRGARAGYYGIVEYFDGIVGRVLSALQDACLDENTIVIYVSDHGESAGENGLWWKSNFYEHSVGVPLIVSAPGRYPQGARREEIVSLLDLGPTLVDIAGGPEMPAISGRSLLPMLTGQDSLDWPDEAVAELIGEGHYVPGRMIRRGPWKLIHYEGSAPVLFNLEEDPHEYVDRANDPSCRDIRNYLHDRVLWGWDPGRAVRQLRRRSRDRGMLLRWRRAWADGPEDPNYWRAPDSANVWPEE